MLALYRSGSQAEALRCYSRLPIMLDDELGITPGPEVADLEQAILDQDPSMAWTQGHVPHRLPHRSSGASWTGSAASPG